MPSTRSERFFLYGYYGQNNLGDDLLLRAAIEGIRRACPRASFVVRNEGHIAGIEGFGGDIVLTGIDRIISDQSRSRFMRLVGTLRAYRRHFRSCGWFVFGGGTVFHERNSILPLALVAAICLLARVTGLRVIALGIGVSPLKSPSARIVMGIIVRMSDVFAVRDGQASAECDKAGVTQRIAQTSDLVFTLSDALTGSGQLYSRSYKKEGPRRVGLSIYPPALDAVEKKASFEALQSAISSILMRGWSVSLLTFHNAVGEAGGNRDQDMLERLVSNISPDMKSRIDLHVLSVNATVLDKAYTNIDVHLGMRFHGHVLAAIYGVPFAGLAVDNKINGICEFFGMPLIEMGKLSEKAILEAVDKAVMQHVDEEKRKTSIALAEKNFLLFSSIYQNRARLRPHAETSALRE